MIQTLIIALPGLVALIVCMSRGPEQALLDVYLPTLLLLPQNFTWPTSLRLPFADTTILPIGLFLLFRPQRERRWSSIDLLIIGYIAITAIAEGVNNGYKLGQQAAVQEFLSVFLTYFAVKQSIGQQQFVTAFAKRIVMLITITAILSVYEFRMGSDLFLWPFEGIFPTQPGWNLVFRAGWMRTQGPYGHAIAAGTIMAMGYRIARWLDWSGEWADPMGFLPISKIRFCELCIIAGSIMTISVGPWVGAVGGAMAVFVCRARNRKRALALLIFAILVVGLPGYSAFKAYVSLNQTWSANASDSERLQEDAAYRDKLLQVFIPVVEERPSWGWGRRKIPMTEGMWSIDDGYLFIALTSGLYALGFFVALLVGTPIRLCVFGLRLPRGNPAALAAFSLMGIYLLTAICLSNVSLGATDWRVFFLIIGWSAGLLKSSGLEAAEAKALVPGPHAQFVFQRVMA
jgi:hypothetical protein